MARDQRLTKEEIQEDKFIEGLLTTYQFLKENLRTIIIVVGIVLIAVAGYAAYYQNQENRRAEATIALRDATETYRTAEESLFDAEKLAESEESLASAQTQLQQVFEKYPNTAFADQARYQYASSLYYQGNYAEARSQFQQIIANHQPENQIYSLYAQKAIGNTYEQESNYEKAVDAYQAKAFPPTPELPAEIRQFVLAEAKFNQAIVYEKLGNADAARAAYKEIVDEFRTTLEVGISQKSLEVIEDAKVVIAALGETLDLSNAEKLESEKRYYEAYVAYTDAIRTYKVNKDIQGGLSTELRKQIGSFEKEAITLINSIQNARRADDEGRESSALYSYDLVVELEKLGLSRRLYENALLHYKRLGSVQ
ncbi:tetratricopeptide repeat protein [Candidatus Poribacteria bacterium]|nr:tetratricopeptide repeat protein [Candidatus Poribacteria bacterium]MYA57058.1 tetratricopeptide repeat protein [Candidatus Poribacteria bacterium]